jgi:hypothetical protein
METSTQPFSPIVYGENVNSNPTVPQSQREIDPQQLFVKSAEPPISISSDPPPSHIELNLGYPKESLPIVNAVNPPSERGIARCTVVMWVLNFLVLGLVFAFALVEGTQYFNSTTQDLSESKQESIVMDTRLGLGISLGLVYLIYLIGSCNSKMAKYSSNLKNVHEASSCFAQMQQSAPYIAFVVDCYHYETRRSTHRDSKGHTHHTTRRVKVTTYTARHNQGFSYNFDRSSFPNLSETTKRICRIKVKKELLTDSVGQIRLNNLRGQLYTENAYRDSFCDVYATPEIPGYESHMIVITRGDKPWYFGSWVYGLLCFVGFWFVFKLIIHGSSIPVDAKVSKKASFDVQNPDHPEVQWQVLL